MIPAKAPFTGWKLWTSPPHRRSGPRTTQKPVSSNALSSSPMPGNNPRTREQGAGWNAEGAPSESGDFRAASISLVVRPIQPHADFGRVRVALSVVAGLPCSCACHVLAALKAHDRSMQSAVLPISKAKGYAPTDCACSLVPPFAVRPIFKRLEAFLECVKPFAPERDEQHLRGNVAPALSFSLIFHLVHYLVARHRLTRRASS